MLHCSWLKVINWLISIYTWIEWETREELGVVYSVNYLMEWGCDSRGNSSLCTRAGADVQKVCTCVCDGRKQTRRRQLVLPCEWASELPVWRLCARLTDGESTFCSKLQTMPPVLPVESFKQSWLERVELNFILLKLEWDRFSKLNRWHVARQYNHFLVSRATTLFYLSHGAMIFMRQLEGSCLLISKRTIVLLLLKSQPCRKLL
jgi:hypothetical protein